MSGDLRLADLRRVCRACAATRAAFLAATIRFEPAFTPPPMRPIGRFAARSRRRIFAADGRRLASRPRHPGGRTRAEVLSGGQRQRLALARALIADPAVLLLDDCTSALDSETEARVRSAVSTLRPGRTTLIVSHKPSSVRQADLIIVLDHGRIVERGTHASLIAHGGYYTSLLAAHSAHPVMAGTVSSRRVS